MTANRPERAAMDSSGAPEVPALAVRWLAEQCGLAGAPAPHLASAMLTHDVRAVAHIAWWSRHADPESNFERANRDLADGPDAVRVAALIDRGYDGLLYLQDGAIVGHLFFQHHGDEMHAFAAWTDERFRHKRFKHNKLLATAVIDFIGYAYAVPGVVRVRLGAADNAVGENLLARVQPAAAQLGWRVREGCWLDF